MAIPRQEWARVEHNPGPLHLCAACRSRLVHPIEWEEAGRGSWTVSLRCPNCWWTGSGTYAQELVDALELELDEGVDALVDDLRRLARANMAEAVERFVTALRADAVLPEDF